jgi:hypothetical protein
MIKCGKDSASLRMLTKDLDYRPNMALVGLRKVCKRGLPSILEPACSQSLFNKLFSTLKSREDRQALAQSSTAERR